MKFFRQIGLSFVLISCLLFSVVTDVLAQSCFRYDCSNQLEVVTSETTNHFNKPIEFPGYLVERNVVNEAFSFSSIAPTFQYLSIVLNRFFAQRKVAVHNHSKIIQLQILRI